MIAQPPAAPPVRTVPAGGTLPDPLPAVRQAVRELLEATPEFHNLDPGCRRQMAQAMVKVCHTAASLIREEAMADAATSVVSHQPTVASAAAFPTGDRSRASGQQGGAVATALNAGREFSGVAAHQVAGTTRRILNAVSFPRFVTELINGVFTAILDSSQAQLQMYIELLNNVAATTEGFADTQIGPGRARQWLVDRYPDAFQIESTHDPEFDDPEDRAEAETRLALRPGARMPSEAALRTDLGLAEHESAPSGDPERTLVPFARRRLAKMRQEMLATMLMMGMQRIVVDSGRITAAMRFHIDTRSAAEVDAGSRTELGHQAGAQANFMAGPWGVGASAQHHFSYVSTQNTRTTEELNTDLELNSSVEINFRSDYVPLNRLASPGQAERIEANSRAPDFEAARRAEEARRTAARQSDATRRQAIDTALRPSPPQPLAVPATPEQASGRRAPQSGQGQAGGGSQGGSQGGRAQGGGSSSDQAERPRPPGSAQPVAAPPQASPPASAQPASAQPTAAQPAASRPAQPQTGASQSGSAPQPTAPAPASG